MMYPQRKFPPRSKRDAAAARALPRIVLFYNRWTDFESETIGRQFRPMTAAEFEAIAVGDEVWMRRDPIHPNGKVYGYARKVITRVTCMPNGDIRLSFASGFTTVSLKRSTHPCAVVDDPRTLARLIAAHPLATLIHAD